MKNEFIKIKICGLTKSEEAEFLNRNKVDYAGMVLFYDKSRRNISIEQAKIIMKALDNSIKKVAVVVSPSIEQITEIERAGFDYVQIHGEIPEGLSANINIPVLKAFNITDMDKYEEYRNSDKIAGYVFDAHEPGSGKTFDWSMMKNLPRDDKLFVLAGGLNAGNVCEAVKYLKPDVVDVSSGVENDNGKIKDEKKICEFVKKVRNIQ